DEVIHPGAPWIGHAARFLRDHLTVDLRDLTPDDDWIIEGDNAIAAASAGKEYVVYLEEGGNVQLDLSDVTGNLAAQWYNPRTGEYTGVEIVIQEGEPNQFTSPAQGSGSDWVLHIHPIVSSLGELYNNSDRSPSNASKEKEIKTHAKPND
ncbi:MAG: putative collagen-binding domain-containing protein, partial [Candidatus Hinthialibacter sp.]